MSNSIYEIVYDQGGNLGLKCLNGCGQARWTSNFQTKDWSTNEDCPNCLLMKSENVFDTEKQNYLEVTQGAIDDLFNIPANERSDGGKTYLEFHVGQMTPDQLATYNAEQDALKEAAETAIENHQSPDQIEETQTEKLEPVLEAQSAKVMLQSKKIQEVTNE